MDYHFISMGGRGEGHGLWTLDNLGLNLVMFSYVLWLNFSKLLFPPLQKPYLFFLKTYYSEIILNLKKISPNGADKSLYPSLSFP